MPRDSDRAMRPVPGPRPDTSELVALLAQGRQAIVDQMALGWTGRPVRAPSGWLARLRASASAWALRRLVRLGLGLAALLLSASAGRRIPRA